MGSPRPRSRDDRGDTLLELIIAVVIIGVALVVILGAVATAVLMSDTHRKQAEAGAAVRGYAEAIETTVAGGGYVPCADTAAYRSPAGFSAPTGFDPSVTAVGYWTGSGWSTSGCTTTTDRGLQRVTVEVREHDATTEQLRVVETLILIVRRP